MIFLQRLQSLALLFRSQRWSASFALALAIALPPAHAEVRLFNLGFNASSGSYPGYEGQYAVDQNPATLWNSGRAADPSSPVFIEVDLRKLAKVRRIRMTVAQYPAGWSDHQFYGRGADGTWLVYYGQQASTTWDGLTFDIVSSSDVEVRYILIQTTQSSGWVAWREIEVYEADPPPPPPPPPPPSGTMRIMPLGDSITAGFCPFGVENGPDCTPLQECPGGVIGPDCKRVLPSGDCLDPQNRAINLTAAGYRRRLRENLNFMSLHTGLNYDLVGGMSSGPYQFYDAEHEGHGGWRIDQISGCIGGWITTSKPDVILLHAGTNDILQGATAAIAIARLKNLLKAINTAKVPVILAKLIPIPDHQSEVDAFNTLLQNEMTNNTLTSESGPMRISLVDLGLNASGLSADRVHPNETGYNTMGDAWATKILNNMP